MQNDNKLICVVGPTASGKTALSIALAKQLNTEIISADSMQIYKELDIGTAKPSMQERDGIIHHMLDIIDSNDSFSVARYVEQADKCAQNIIANGKIPIVAGGTGLYMESLIECSTFSGDETDMALRTELEQLAQQNGNEYVHDILAKVDPVSAQRLHPNNLKRVIRAIEVFRQTGKTIDEYNAQNKSAEPKYDAIIIGLCPENREVLYNRINMRVDLMIEQGLLEETIRLYSDEKIVGTAAQAIGYKELIDYIENRDSLENCIEILKRRTRNYAKRQLTWFKRNKNINWIFYDENENLSQLQQKATNFLNFM